jgi:hypothetical protein
MSAERWYPDTVKTDADRIEFLWTEYADDGAELSAAARPGDAPHAEATN